MKPIVVREYGKIARGELSPLLQRELQRFDELHARSTADSIFDWSHHDYLVAKNYVGVVQIPGLQIEILPKIDFKNEQGQETTGMQQARHNLLYMLSVTKHLPLKERDLAGQRIQKIPMLEALIHIFVTRLLKELRRGQQHLYVNREENLPYVKGRILMHRQITLNSVQRHLNYVAFDEFQADTWLNRILKAACARLLSLSRVASSQQYLRECLLEMADVQDFVIQPHHFDKALIDRNSEPFEILLSFSRLLLFGDTPAPNAGDNQCFSLLFPMEVLFEKFVGEFLRRYASSLGLIRADIHLQAHRRRRWLLKDKGGSGRFQLKPDILIDDKLGCPGLILDTKWKRLVRDVDDRKNGVAQSDIYQLYAYSQRYRCRDNVLLFPNVDGVTPKKYTLDGVDNDVQIRVEYLDLNYDLQANRDRLIFDLRAILGDACGVFASQNTE